MDNKKLGLVILGLSGVAIVITLGFMGTLNQQTQALNCYPNSECNRVSSLLGLSHMAVGLISFVLALGFYLLFFSTSEDAILKRLEDEKNMKIEQDKFDLVLKGMDDYERRVIKAIKSEEGITQSTLKYRVDLSKAKVSQILTDFEKKNLVKRELKGKTYSVYLRENFS